NLRISESASVDVSADKRTVTPSSCHCLSDNASRHFVARSSVWVFRISRISSSLSRTALCTFVRDTRVSLSDSAAAMRASSPRIEASASKSRDGPSSSMEPSSLYERNGRYVESASVHPRDVSGADFPLYETVASPSSTSSPAFQERATV